jgi:hypothetical protein
MTTCYIATPDTWPCAYHTVPATTVMDKRTTRYTACPAFVVHSKGGYGGNFKKHQEYVVRGLYRDELLVQKIGDVKPDGFDSMIAGFDADKQARWIAHYADGSWHTLRFDQTSEGYRFVRTVRKAIEVIAKLAREGGKTRAKVAKTAKDFEDRGQRCGICPCCFGDYVADKTTGAKLVHHGYARPGDGMIHGDCYGVGYAPYEVSCEGTKMYRGIVQSSLKLRQDQLAGLAKLTEIRYQTGRGTYETRPGLRHGQYVPEYATAKKGSREFQQEITSQRDTLERQIGNLTRHIADLTEKITTWAPQAFPRKA